MAKTKKICIFVLRLLAVAATLSAAVVMATSNQSSSFFGVPVQAKYYYEPAFKFFVIANGIGSVYSFLVLFLPPKSMLWRLVVALDVVITVLLTSSISAAAAIAYVGKKGNSRAGWLPICGQFPKFCNQGMAALILGLGGVLIYMILLLYAIHTVINPLLL
ncbi:CASP-like protein 1C1 [Aristolochia californica]|uniref:CASP-like protein 1C1 n=1 Tax=Aristolochia californica TaxID=171875 RepID=UPI0035DB19E7